MMDKWKWISVEDQLPPEYQDVLLYIPSHGKAWFYYGAMCVGSYSKKKNCFVMDSVSIDALYAIDKPLDLVTSNEASEFMYNFEPSHWKKLPKRPYADWETLGYRLKLLFLKKYNFFKFYYNKLK